MLTQQQSGFIYWIYFWTCLTVAKSPQNMIDHVIKTSSPLMQLFFKKVSGLVVWHTYFIWRWAVLFKFVGEERKNKKNAAFCKQSSAETCNFPPRSQWYTTGFPLKCCFLTFSDRGTIHSSFLWFCNVFNYLYSSRSLVRKRAQRGICLVNQLSPNLFLSSGSRKHTVCTVFLPSGTDMLTGSDLSTLW